MADDNEANRNDALTTLLGIAGKIDEGIAANSEPNMKIAEVATPFLVLIGDALGNLQRIADALEAANTPVNVQASAQHLTEDEWDMVKAVREDRAYWQSKERRTL
jgi:hypothetical protein